MTLVWLPGTLSIPIPAASNKKAKKIKTNPYSPLQNTKGLINTGICGYPSEQQQLNKKPVKTTNMLHVSLYSKKHFLLYAFAKAAIYEKHS